MTRRPEIRRSDRRPILIPTRRPVWRFFRWEWVLVPLVIIAAVWFIGGIVPSIAWVDITSALGVVHKERYSELAVLCLSLIGVVWIAKILRPR